MIIGTLIETGKLLGMLAVAGAILAACPRTRRCGYAAVRYGKRHMSPWMLAVVGVCLAVPGPLDELLVGPVLVLLTLRTARNRAIFTRYMRTAWEG